VSDFSEDLNQLAIFACSFLLEGLAREVPAQHGVQRTVGIRAQFRRSPRGCRILAKRAARPPTAAYASRWAAA
jgi:hypothetical protein